LLDCLLRLGWWREAIVVFSTGEQAQAAGSGNEDEDGVSQVHDEQRDRDKPPGLRSFRRIVRLKMRDQDKK
jgi:hypothetical protein